MPTKYLPGSTPVIAKWRAASMVLETLGPAIAEQRRLTYRADADLPECHRDRR